MPQTTQQVANSLNPTPFNVNLPGDGSLFINPNGAYIDSLYLRQGNNVSQFSLTGYAKNYLSQAGIDLAKLSSASGRQLGQGPNGTSDTQYNPALAEMYQKAQSLGLQFTSTANNWGDPGFASTGSFGTNTLADFGKTLVKSQLGIDVGSLPGFNTGDVLSGLKNGNQIQQISDPTVLKTATTAPSQNVTLNNTPNSLGAGVLPGVQPATVGNGTNPGATPQNSQLNANANYYGQFPGSGLPTSSGTSQSGPGGSSPGATGQPDFSNLPPEFQGLYTQLQQYLEKLKANGQVLNPAIQLTPQKIAEFLSQAHAEIDPYYSGQLKLATESLSSQLGYAQNQLQTGEQRAQTAYQDQLRGIGENAADQGFALSGLRNRDEGKLATDTNNSLTDARNAFSYNAGNAARGFAQQYGTANLPSLNINGAPSVTAGEQNFTQSTRQLPLYQLSSSIYDGLKGTSEYQQNTDVQNRASQLESAFNSNNAITQARQLNL